MSEELQKPPVINLEDLLAPISEDKPAGDYQRYSGVYDEISEARRADDLLDQGAWQMQLKTADYRQVIYLCNSALITQTKDIQIAAWFSEALVKEHGFAGLRDSLKLLTGLQDIFWDTLHPEIDEGDMEGRANAVTWVDTQTSLAARNAPLTAGAGYGLLGWEDSRRFDFPENIDTLDSGEQERYRSLMEQAQKGNRVTAELWNKAKALTTRAFCEELNFVIEECWTEYREINRVIEERYDRNQMPSLTNLKKALEDIQIQAKKLLEEKRAEEPDPADDQIDSADDTEGSSEETGVTGPGVRAATGAIQNRQDALKRLADVAGFFQKTEPHSPVSYLVNRAVKWGNMPLEGWLQEVIKDDSVLSQLREMLGMSPPPEDSSY